MFLLSVQAGTRKERRPVSKAGKVCSGNEKNISSMSLKDIYRGVQVALLRNYIVASHA